MVSTIARDVGEYAGAFTAMLAAVGAVGALVTKAIRRSVRDDLHKIHRRIDEHMLHEERELGHQSAAWAQTSLAADELKRDVQALDGKVGHLQVDVAELRGEVRNLRS